MGGYSVQGSNGRKNVTEAKSKRGAGRFLKLTLKSSYLILISNLIELLPCRGVGGTIA